MYHQGREFVGYIKSVPNAICVKRYTVKNDAVIIINSERIKIEKKLYKNYIKIQKSNIVNGNNNNIKKQEITKMIMIKPMILRTRPLFVAGGRGKGEGGRGRGEGWKREGVGGSEEGRKGLRRILVVSVLKLL